MKSLLKHVINTIKALISKDFWITIANYTGLRESRSNVPLTNTELLREFLSSRASHVAQTSLYGYLKTRAGTRFPEMFEDPGLLLSMNMAKWQIWLACLSDLSIYVGGLLHHQANQDSNQVGNILVSVIKPILKEIGVPEDSAPEFKDTTHGVIIRVTNTDYSSVTDDEYAFTASPDALYKWAPIADELKQYDKEIVRNSVRFRWQEIRRDVRKWLNAESIILSFTKTTSE